MTKEEILDACEKYKKRILVDPFSKSEEFNTFDTGPNNFYALNHCLYMIEHINPDDIEKSGMYSINEMREDNRCEL